jgi:hypothetical protein
VHTVSNINLITITQAGRVRGADVRALAMTGAPVAATRWMAVDVMTDVQGTTVCAYRHNSAADVVLTGAFPGLPAWSPPI